MTPELSWSGISIVGDMPWGLHFSLFYQTRADLLDVIVPYLTAGLEGDELCVWMPTDPSAESEAIEGMRRRVPDFDHRMERGDIQFSRYDGFLDAEGSVDIDLAIAQWDKWEVEARERGYAGLRGSGNPIYLDQLGWKNFNEYEGALHKFMAGRRMRVLCSYAAEALTAADLLDSAQTHHYVIARRRGQWEVLESPALKQTKDELQRLNDELEQRVTQRTSELGRANDELHGEIEERLRVEAELRRSETYLEQGQRLSHTGSYAVNPTIREFTFWSPEIFRILGLEPRARPLTREETYEHVHPADRDRVRRLTTAVIAERRHADTEFRIVRPDGKVRYVHVYSDPVMDESGRVVEVVGSMIDITDRKRAAGRLAKAKRTARERTLEHRFAATLEERTRLAREIHDSLLQGVTGIALQLRATLPHLGDAPRETVASIRAIVELADSTVRDARHAVWDIRAPALTQKGLLVALEEELRRAATGAAITFTIKGTPRALSAPLEDTMFRIGQEAVVNAAKHSGADTIAVLLAFRPRSVRMTVVDDGRGFRADPAGGTQGGRWGLLGMRERAKRIGATLVIRSAEGKGTTVELRARSEQGQSNRGKLSTRRLHRAS